MQRILHTDVTEVLAGFHLLKSPDADVRVEAALQLCEQGQEQGIKILVKAALLLPEENQKRLIHDFGRTNARRVVPVLRIYISKGPHRLAALEALKTVGDRNIYPLLVSLLKDDDAQLQYKAALYLEELDKPEGLAAIVATLNLYPLGHQLSNWFINYALKIAQKHKISIPIKTAEVLLQDRGWDIKKNCIIALGSGGVSDAVPLLLGLLNEKDVFGDTRIHVIQSLGMIGDVRAKEPLNEVASSDPNRGIRKAASDALKQLRGD